jgi:hypothetical protein
MHNKWLMRELRFVASFCGEKIPQKEATALRRHSQALFAAAPRRQQRPRIPPLVARREEPHNKRIERMSTGPSKLAPAATVHPRAVMF